MYRVYKQAFGDHPTSSIQSQWGRFRKHAKNDEACPIRTTSDSDDLTFHLTRSNWRYTLSPAYSAARGWHWRRCGIISRTKRLQSHFLPYLLTLIPHIGRLSTWLGQDLKPGSHKWPTISTVLKETPTWNSEQKLIRSPLVHSNLSVSDIFWVFRRNMPMRCYINADDATPDLHGWLSQWIPKSGLH